MSVLPPGARLRRSPRVVARRVAGELVLVSTRDFVARVLNEPAAELWARLEGCTLSELLHALPGDSGGERRREDARRFVESAYADGLIDATPPD